MDCISFDVPEDGGTPRSSDRILRLSPHEFLIRAVVEEGRCPLTHPVSRLDLVSSNAGVEPVTVTLHLDLSRDGVSTNFEESIWGGMSRRDFVFVQTPGRDWQQVDGTTQGSVCTVRFAAQPGENKIGLSPWYTYADFLGFVKSLPDHPHLQKTLMGHSDGGREHWELVITDPEVPSAKKKRVVWQAREHAYETFSSFAIEGAIAYLLKDGAAEIRRDFEITLHPMCNVDGVAQGYEYRAGYDLDGLETTASGRLVLATRQRLRPHTTVTWHNWIAPRDVDSLFYTDDQNGLPTRRAWDLLTQRFPSPRSVDHRWEHEDEPLVQNWFKGRELDPANPDTRVWGWEMPWWRRNVATARRLGSAFAEAFFDTLPLLTSDAAPTQLSAASTTIPEVPRWDSHEFLLQGRAHVANPFRDAALVGHFTSPGGRTVVAEGFHDGGDTWKLRFAPDEEGEWEYLQRGEGVELFEQGRLRCVAPRGHGPIRIDPENPYAFAYADGTPFFPMGDTCYGLYADTPITAELRTEYLRTRRGQRFNFVRMGVLHSPTHWESDPDFWPWGGDPEDPDLDRLNPDYFRGLNAVLSEMKAVGMNAELIMLSFYQWPFTDTDLWTAERERMWLRHLTARYGAFSNLFLWTIANEYETHPDGVYRLDVPGDPDWAKVTARYIKQHDPYGHPVTVHPVMSAMLPDATTPRDQDASADRPWRIGEFFGVDDAMDVISQQTGQDGDWDERQLCWVGDAPYLVASLGADRRYAKPVVNSENGYEYLRGYPTYRQQVHHTDKVRRSSWRIVCAGGCFAAGFAGTLGMCDAFNRVCWGNPMGEEHYSFVIQDEGAGAQLSALYDFFTALPFQRMRPFEGVTGTGEVLALADPGTVYVTYLTAGGKVSVDLSAARGDLTARWFDPREGVFGEAFLVAGEGQREFAAPSSNDWVLELRSSAEAGSEGKRG